MTLTDKIYDMQCTDKTCSVDEEVAYLPSFDTPAR